MLWAGEKNVLARFFERAGAWSERLHMSKTAAQPQ